MKFKFNGNLNNGGSIYGYKHVNGILDIPNDDTVIIDKLSKHSHFEKVNTRKPAPKQVVSKAE